MNIVLIIDDEPVVRLLLEELLSDDPEREVIAAASVAEAQQALAGRAPSVALIERYLEQRSGIDEARELRAADPFTEVVLMSAFPSSDSVLEAVEAGASDYLAKPFEDIQQVLVRVANAEERVRLRRDREELHARLRESEERFRKLFAASPDSILVYDEATKRIQSANDAALRTYGYTADELLQASIDTLRTFGDVPSATGSHRRDWNKERQALEVDVTSGRFVSGGRAMVVEVARDVSQRMSAERARRKLEEQLRHAQKLEAVGMLAGGIAHDFNNLLAVITNYASIMVSVLDDPEEVVDLRQLRDDADQILHAAGSAAGVTRQLLAFSRREVATPEIHAPNVTIHSLEKILRRTLGERVKLVTELDVDAGFVETDRGLLEQVVVNLAVNARDAMPEGGTLSICTARETPSEGGELFVLEVRDSGVGMDPAVADRIFEPFFTTKPAGQGTGLGLATVKGIVEAAGGRISVESQPGQGTTFKVELPGMAEPQHASLRPIDRRAMRALPGETVLLVEDDDAVRGATRRMLQRAGFAVVEARDGHEALRKLDEAPRVDLLLTDAVMPGMNGDVLAREAAKRQSSLAVMFMTGYAPDALRAEATENERLVLEKPFREERLLEWVRSAVDRQKEVGQPVEHSGLRRTSASPRPLAGSASR